jgi:hypothetical protein
VQPCDEDEDGDEQFFYQVHSSLVPQLQYLVNYDFLKSSFPTALSFC